MLALSTHYQSLPKLRVVRPDSPITTLTVMPASQVDPYTQTVYLDRSCTKQVVTMRQVGSLARCTAIVFNVLSEQFSVIDIRLCDKLVIRQ